MRRVSYIEKTPTVEMLEGMLSIRRQIDELETRLATMFTDYEHDMAEDGPSVHRSRGGRTYSPAFRQAQSKNMKKVWRARHAREG